jgi:uncharacterized protein (TIGR02466 family)
MDNNRLIIPLFPRVCALYVLEEDLSELNKIKSFKFKKIDTGSHGTDSFKVLEYFPSIKKLVMEKFYEFKDNILSMNSTNFKISTSWGTKIEPNGMGGLHNHRNTYYSGILYWETFEGSRLELVDLFKQGIMVMPDKWNDFNYQHFHLNTMKNNLFFFPSEIYHRISINNSENTRYSLAFNIMPIGNIGYEDSSVTINIE